MQNNIFFTFKSLFISFEIEYNLLNLMEKWKVNRTMQKKRNTLKSIQQLYFRTQLVLIVTLALFLGIAGTLINIYFETEKRDRNLQNIAEAIAYSPFLTNEILENEGNLIVLTEYLDSLKETLGDIDVISVVNKAGIRVYHSNHSLMGTVYDGNFPKFETDRSEYGTAYETGPSGNQRRAYAAICDKDGTYLGFVMAIMLVENIRNETAQTLFIYAIITLMAILMELLVCAELSEKIKKSLLGYEPDAFSAMYKMRDSILETLKEGILAVDQEGTVQFANEAAVNMLENIQEGMGRNIVGQAIRSIGDGMMLTHTLESGEKEFNAKLGNADILVDRIPIKEDNDIVGAIAILHNRAEYTKLMEDLSGTRYLVDSMRANNHDFTNKLHVILGLIQMEMYEEATAYIQNITMVQRSTISKIMNAVSTPAIAALLIGKTARASELNIRFILREGCCYSDTDLHLPAEVLVTIIGNLIDNAFESMNEKTDYTEQKELLFGIYSKPGAVLITTDDTGSGISKENLQNIFKKGYSTKGEGRGTGLYQVKTMVDALGGKITVESQIGVGSSFSVSFMKENSREMEKKYV